MNSWHCRHRLGWLCGLFLLLGQLSAQTNGLKPTDLVDPFWGSETGNVFPGASVPFGMVKLGPDILKSGVTSGYRANEPIAGFSHTHTSGTGGAPRYGNILLAPGFGQVVPLHPVRDGKTNEFARPGYYTVTLKQGNDRVRVELTALGKVGWHRYTFFHRDGRPSDRDAYLAIDLSHCNTRDRDGKPSTYCTDGQITVHSASEVEGNASFRGGWGGDNPYRIYFVAQFDAPAHQIGVWKNDTLFFDQYHLSADVIQPGATRFGSFFIYRPDEVRTVQVKVAISYLSLARARENLAAIENWDFDSYRLQAEQHWTKYLDRIKITGGTPEQRMMFYSALRNTFVMPTDVTGEIGNWDAARSHFWDHYCIWDVFRTTMPLHTLIAPEVQRAIINSLLDIYQRRGWLPDAWIAGDYAQVQGGSNADVVLADAMVKKLGGFDRQLAYQAMRKNATIPSEDPQKYGRYLTTYRKYGFLPAGTTTGAVSRSLEYAYNDFCVSEVATILGHHSEAKDFRDQSLRIFSLFDDQHQLFWAKDSSLNWMPNFSPVSNRPDHWNDPYFYEGGSIIYSWYVPHAMAALIQRHGGPDAFVAHLDQVFDRGHFQLSNEPAFLLPYLYNYAGRQELTAKRVRDILNHSFIPGNDGLPGQDDSGALSAWYVFSAIGIFPVAGQDMYLIGSPIFSEVVLQLENGKSFSIRAKGVSEKNMFIQSASLNKKPWRQNWLNHCQIIKGGQLVLQMGAQPVDWDGTGGPATLKRTDCKAQAK
ncbi:MAG: GH92 family glycosyl hydrolase [candidate division KSB1 bacterium]|nr:GH92 family glycosyl hydrolase [candidate division KSB1 bacterium]